MQKPKIKVILFDMGGVLIKTTDRQIRTCLAKQFNMTYEQLDELVYATESARKATLGVISETDHFQSVLNKLGAPGYGINRFQQEFWGGDTLDDELVNFISANKGVYRFGLLSNAMSNIRKWLNEKYNFLYLFEITYFSAELGIAKPEPNIYIDILKEFNVGASEAIFVDDFVENVKAAHDLGFHAIHYKSTTQSLEEINYLLNA